MTLEQLVYIYGSSINKHLVSRRVEKNNSGPFKGIKTYKIELWDVKEHKIVCEVECTKHFNTENKASIIESLELNLISEMFTKYATE